MMQVMGMPPPHQRNKEEVVVTKEESDVDSCKQPGECTKATEDDSSDPVQEEGVDDVIDKEELIPEKA